MQASLNVETRTEQLERQHRLLKQARELEEQAENYRTYIKSLREERKTVLAELDKLTTILESEQLTMGAK